jgi:protein ImuA
MTPAAQHRLLDDLRERIRHLDGSDMREKAVLPFGLSVIDEHLPGRGLALGALHEVTGAEGDLSFGAAAALFVAGILARLEGPVLWAVRRPDLFAPGLAGAGVHPDRVIYAEAGNTKTLLLVMEEGLKQAGLAAVVGEVDRLSVAASRRLQLAAEKSGVMALALRRWPFAPGRWNEGDTAAVTRWRVGAQPSALLPVPGIGRARWALDLMRCRNGQAKSWIVEAADAQGHLALPADLRDRPAPARAPRRRAA